MFGPIYVRLPTVFPVDTPPVISSIDDCVFPADNCQRVPLLSSLGGDDGLPVYAVS